MPIDAIVDSRTLFNVVAKSSSTPQKRLQIDVHAIRESRRKGELRHLVCRTENIADGMTSVGCLSDDRVE